MGSTTFFDDGFSLLPPQQLIKSRKFWREVQGFAHSLASSELQKQLADSRRWESIPTAEDLSAAAAEHLFLGLSKTTWNHAPYRANLGGALRTFLHCRILDQLKTHRRRARNHPFTNPEQVTPEGVLNLLDHQDHDVFGPSPKDPLAALILQENQREVLAAIEELPGILREVAHLELYQSASPKETSDILGIPTETVYRHRQTLRRQVQKILTRQGFTCRYLA